MAQRLSNAKAKITGVRIHKPRADSSIASVSMDQYELIFPHLPGLLDVASGLEQGLARALSPSNGQPP